MGFRITTWNVNGIRNPFGYQPWSKTKTFDGMFDILESDIVIMQELKIQRKDLTDDMVLVPGWDAYFSLPKHKKGYSGVGIYTKQATCLPVRAEEGLMGVLCPPGSSTSYRSLPPDQQIGGYPTDSQIEAFGVDPATLDAEGRCVLLEFPAFVLFGVYSPANSNGLRDDFRYGFIQALDARIRNLHEMGKRVVLTGDLNVSREELDTANAEDDLKKAGMSHEEYVSTPNRRLFNQLVENGDVVGERDAGREVPVLWDTCREMHPNRKGMFTHWEQKINARPANYGSRIDYVLCSLSMKEWVQEADIQEGLMGSDHCPVYAVLKDQVGVDGETVQLADTMSPVGFFKDGKRLREHSMKHLPATCARLFTDFDKRRSIKDMFTAKTRVFAADAELFETSALDAQEASPAKPTLSQQSTIESPLRAPSTSQASAPSPLRRKTSAASSTPNASLKRKRESAPMKQPPALKGQQSLKGFFKAKTPVLDPSPIIMMTDHATTRPEDTTLPVAPTSVTDSPSAEVAASAPTIPPRIPTAHEEEAPDASPSTASPAKSTTSEKVIDQVASKETWNALFTKKAPPLCESHQEPCISLLSKKKGFNNGRYFWICPRPLGPSGAKEVGTQWRCRTFVWASDWGG